MPMSAEGSVSNWIGQLKAGDREAIQQLWERYAQRLVALARARLGGAPRRAADEEDVALSAFHSFCRAAERGRFPRLLDRDNLWRLLVVLTSRKASHLVRHERRQKRHAPAPDPAANPDAPEPAVVRLQEDEFAQQGGALEPGDVLQEVLDAGAGSRGVRGLPGGLEAVARLVQPPGQRPIARRRVAHGATSPAQSSRISRSLRSTVRGTQPSFAAISSLA